MNRLVEPAPESSISVPDSGSQLMSKRQEFWLLLAIFAIAAALRIGLAGGIGLWGDEIFSLATATGHSLEHPAAAARPELGDFVEPDHPLPPQEYSRYVNHQQPLESPARVVRAVLLSDTNPPLYYLLLYGWTIIFGTTDLALRLFSASCALACFPFLIGIARRTGGRRAVVATCVLFALSPLAIYYSLEGRMYSLLWLWVLATAWVSLVIQQRRGNVGLLVIWTLVSVAGLLTHYFFVFPWLAVVAYLALKPGRLNRFHLALCFLATAALVFPWYIHLPETFARWRITKGWLNWRPTGFSELDSLSRILSMFFTGHEKRLWLGSRLTNMPPLILFGVIAAAMVWKMRGRVLSRGRLLLFLLFVAVCAGPFAFDLVQGTYSVAWPRYAIAALPAAYLLAAVGLTCFRSRTAMVILILIVLAWVPNLLGLKRTRFWWAPTREISRTLWIDSSPSDLVLVHSIPSGVISIARYATGPAKIASWIEQLGNRRVPQSITSLAQGHARIVYVKVHEAGSDAPEADWLRAQAVVFKQTPIGLCKIIDFRPSGSKTF
jgi:dolichyl-phosphate-mannose-protein mannosyltransferase